MTTEERLEMYLTKTPDLSEAAFVAKDAQVMGAVSLKKDASIFYGCVLRGDINTIEIGEGTNIQDSSIIHLADDAGVQVGDYTTVGHRALLHACKVGNECLIGMGAIVLDYSDIGDRCIVGAHSLVTKGTKIPPGSMVMGTPAKVIRPLTEQEQMGLRPWAEKYVIVAKAHAALLNK